MTKYSRFATEVLLPCGHGTVPTVDRRKARYQLDPGESRIERWGIFAAELIPSRRVVIEYTGEWITEEQAEFRMMRERTYLFEWDDEWTIDGAMGGSGAQFINHSCDPNLGFRRWNRKVLFYSLREIEVGEELTLDYHLSPGSGLEKCRCGSSKCRGWFTAAPSA